MTLAGTPDDPRPVLPSPERALVDTLALGTSGRDHHAVYRHLYATGARLLFRALCRTPVFAIMAPAVP